MCVIRHGRGTLAARYRRIMPHHLLTRSTTYQELGDDYYDRLYAKRAKPRALETLERPGHCVTLEAAA